MSIKRVPLRQCIDCGEMKTKKKMIRVLETPEGEITLDATGKRSDRGAYICPTVECLEEAIKSKSLERSFKMTIPREVYGTLEKEMERPEG